VVAFPDSHGHLQLPIDLCSTVSPGFRSNCGGILATHQPPPLPEGAAEKIEAILEAAEEREWERQN